MEDNDPDCRARQSHVVERLAVAISGLALLALSSACGGQIGDAPTPSAVPTPAPTDTPVLVAALAPSPETVATRTPRPTATPTPSRAPTTAPSPAPTVTPTPEATPTATALLAQTPTALPTNTPPPLPTHTPTAAPTHTAIPQPTDTPAPLPTGTPTTAPTYTPAPRPTDTPAPLPTNTVVPQPTDTPTAEPTATPTLEPTATPTQAPAPPDVRIACIFFDGEVPRTESDEYVAIVNEGGSAHDITGWRLLDIADGRPQFVFPSWTLEPGETIRVYTNQVHSDSGGFSFGSRGAIWSNSDPDEAGLYDLDGTLVSSKSYPPGC